jgi:hypothetical protein
MTTLC